MAKKQKPKILVALTAQRMMFARTTAALLNSALANAHNQDFEFDFYMEMGCEIASARNRCATIAKERGATHLLFVDYDMFFPGDAIAKLLNEDKDIIGAAYNTRGDGSRPTAVPVETASETEPFKCQALGTGFLLIKTSVFDKFTAPWFMFGFTDKGELHYGEDTYFCQRAIKEANFDVWAHPGLGIKHIGEQLF